MKTCKRFYLMVSIIMLVAILLLPGTIVPTPTALADGDIVFIEHTITSSFDGASSVYATDLDGDGDVDVLGTAGNAHDVVWWENDGSQNFTEHDIDTYFDCATSVYAADLDGDNDVDVLGAAWTADEIAWWENGGKHVITNTFDGASFVYATDLDNDNDVDVLGAASQADDIVWWENVDGSGTDWTRHIITDTFDSAKSVYTIDLDDDGDVDVLGAATLADDIIWWENDGNEIFTSHVVDDNFDGAYSVYAADVNGDGNVDVLSAAYGYGAGAIAWWENDGSQSFTKYIIDGDFDGGESVYAVDLDGDSDMDVLGTAYWADDIVWWENTDGSGTNWVEHPLNINFNGANTVYATDLDGDGDMDVLGSASIDDKITWWEQSTPPAIVVLPIVLKNYAPPTEPPSAPVLDEISNLDGDGDYTVSWSGVSGATSYTLEEDDNADFSSPDTVYSGSYTSTSIADRDVGTYYYQVKASNALGGSGWSNIESVEVTVSPPSCDVSCSTPYGYCTGSWMVDISCEPGSYYHPSYNCYYCQVGGIIGTCCDVTRTYNESGHTYYMDSFYYNYAGFPHCRLSVDVWGGAFGSDIQHCQNY